MKKLRLDSFVFAVVLFILGCSNAFAVNKPAISELENRALKTMPKFSLSAVFMGNFFKDFEEYYSDTFIQRENFVKLSRSIRSASSFSKSKVNLVMSVKPSQTQAGSSDKAGEAGGKNTGNLSGTSAGPSSGSSAGSNAEGGAVQNGEAGSQPTPKPTPAPRKKEFDENRNVGYYLVVDGKAVELFKFNKKGFEYYSSVLNKFNKELSGKVNIYSMIAPSAGEFMEAYRYKGVTDSQNSAIDFLNSRLDNNITPVNVLDALNRHKEDYIYFRTDHHWTALGAYHAYSAFMEAKGEKPVPLDKYPMTKVESFLGSSYSKTLDESLVKYADTIEIYNPFINYKFDVYYGDKREESKVIDMDYANTKDKYAIFMSSGGGTWSVIKTEVNNGKRLLVVKDSFGNSLVPFMIPHYEEVYTIDARFYNPDVTGKSIIKFIEDYKINDVVFVNSVENVNYTGLMEGVEEMMKE